MGKKQWLGIFGNRNTSSSDKKSALDKIRDIYKNYKPAPIGKHSFFSVLVPLVEKDGALYIMYEVRSKELDSDPGEICFPGGHVEAGETYLETALRETYEETGISSDKVEVLGEGNTLYGYANYTLYSFIGVISYEDYINADIEKNEVDELFLMPLSSLDFSKAGHFRGRVHPEITDEFPYREMGLEEDYNWRIGEWVIPVLFAENRVLWGMTARITENILELLKDNGIDFLNEKN